MRISALWRRSPGVVASCPPWLAPPYRRSHKICHHATVDGCAALLRLLALTIRPPPDGSDVPWWVCNDPHRRAVPSSKPTKLGRNSNHMINARAVSAIDAYRLPHRVPGMQISKIESSLDDLRHGADPPHRDLASICSFSMGFSFAVGASAPNLAMSCLTRLDRRAGRRPSAVRATITQNLKPRLRVAKNCFAFEQ
ncbi:hypothetical protein WSK_3276 [Novosphingobium sp. Rr 2-17]|nr:hypothetical protein WSK_3276 [Novosphingobium sp. Rr 2-17]